MPDAKSLLPGRAFRSEHAQLRPEPHSIASHGPAPMDPLQTTRMRNGVLYAAEWPCCHDPLRFSLGSDDLLRARNNPRSLLPFLSRELSRRSRPLAPPPSLTRSGAEPRGRERCSSAQGSTQATAQPHPALPEPPQGAPAVPSGLNVASGAGGASRSNSLLPEPSTLFFAFRSTHYAPL